MGEPRFQRGGKCKMTRMRYPAGEDGSGRRASATHHGDGSIERRRARRTSEAEASGRGRCPAAIFSLPPSDASSTTTTTTPPPTPSALEPRERQPLTPPKRKKRRPCWQRVNPAGAEKGRTAPPRPEHTTWRRLARRVQIRGRGGRCSRKRGRNSRSPPPRRGPLLSPFLAPVRPLSLSARAPHATRRAEVTSRARPALSPPGHVRGHSKAAGRKKGRGLPQDTPSPAPVQLSQEERNFSVIYIHVYIYI